MWGPLPCNCCAASLLGQSFLSRSGDLSLALLQHLQIYENPLKWHFSSNRVPGWKGFVQAWLFQGVHGSFIHSGHTVLTTEHSSVPGTGSHSEGGGLTLLGGETVWVMATDSCSKGESVEAWGLLRAQRDGFLTPPQSGPLWGTKGLIGGTGGSMLRGLPVCLGAPTAQGHEGRGGPDEGSAGAAGKALP